MLNFLVTDICGLEPIDYFKHIVQFETTLEAEIYFAENDVNTDQIPFYTEQYEYSPVDENTAVAILKFAKNNKINKFTLVESDYYKALCFTEKERNNFVAQRIEGSTKENLELTDVETTFVFGFTNT